MARLIIRVDVAVDPRFEDPHVVAEDLLFDGDIDNAEIRQYADCETRFVDAEWAGAR